MRQHRRVGIAINVGLTAQLIWLPAVHAEQPILHSVNPAAYSSPEGVIPGTVVAPKTNPDFAIKATWDTLKEAWPVIWPSAVIMGLSLFLPEAVAVVLSVPDAVIKIAEFGEKTGMDEKLTEPHRPRFLGQSFGGRSWRSLEEEQRRFLDENYKKARDDDAEYQKLRKAKMEQLMKDSEYQKFLKDRAEDGGDTSMLPLDSQSWFTAGIPDYRNLHGYLLAGGGASGPGVGVTCLADGHCFVPVPVSSNWNGCGGQVYGCTGAGHPGSSATASTAAASAATQKASSAGSSTGSKAASYAAQRVSSAASSAGSKAASSAAHRASSAASSAASRAASSAAQRASSAAASAASRAAAQAGRIPGR